MAFLPNTYYTHGNELYNCVNIDIMDRYKRLLEGTSHDSNLFNFNNILFHSIDTSLTLFYTYELLSWHSNREISQMNISKTQIVINEVEITFKSSDFFIEINLDKHLNKERIACIEFIKQISNQKNVVQSKHIVILLNLQKLNNIFQYRLRRIIENSHSNCIFIAITSNYNSISEQLRSNFLKIRIPCLSIDQKKNIYTFSCYKLSENGLNEELPSLMSTLMNNSEDVKITTIKTKAVFKKNGEPKYLASVINYMNNECITLEDVILYSICSKINQEDFPKNSKLFKFVHKEVSGILKDFCKFKSVYHAIEAIRTMIFKLLHYNIKHEQICYIIINYITENEKNAPLLLDNIHEVVNIVSEFDVYIRKLSVCKIVHAYENMFFKLFALYSKSC